MVWKGNISHFRRQAKGAKTGETTATKIGFHAFHDNFYLHKFLSWSYFWPPWTIAHGSVPISPKPKRLRPPNLMCMHLTSIPICMIFLGQFGLIKFFDVHGSKGKFSCFWKYQYLRNQRDHAHQIWCTCIWHQSLLAWFFWANSDWLNFLMNMDYSPWVEREIWPFLKVPISPKPKRPRPPKSMYIHVTSMPTCMNFFGQFRWINFFDDHGL